jgi:hypothetical protein
MPLLTRVQLCAELGVSQAQITMGVNRGQLTLTDGKYINTDLEDNALWISNRKATASMRVAGPAQSKSEPEKTIPAQTKNEQPRTESGNFSGDTLVRLRAKKELTLIKKVEQETEVIMLKKEKLQREHIPIEYIKALLISQSENVRVAWEFATDDLLIKLATRMRLTRIETSDIKRSIVDIVNAAVKKQAEETKKSLRKILNEYGDKRGKGERT